ncbi:hypothetical protein JL100_034545 (plasmid) [Skermanella mucosa]|uniref:hypothetical protein n=1 Tax=Skermanella TaxID=204447 RepID=UPI00192B149B|nr:MULTISPECIES: hypothetical protein [Skermanella]UEM07082.1 hypothetical protein JL101_029200 [Skermanella rosea]UEM24859.1 hypothetical protein JL100_034545 [Skermanella mucosa]
MRTLGKLLVIWGALLPLLILPTTADRISQKVAVLNLRLDYQAYMFGEEVDYDSVIVAGLIIVGIGLSINAIGWAGRR